ncbi:MAG: glycosyltransferase family 4 protein [bacterium]
MYLDAYTVQLALFVSCLLLTLILTRAFREVAITFNVYDPPGDRKLHESPTPYLGGLAVFLGFFVPLLYYTSSVEVFYFFVGCLFVCSLGLIDDLYGLSCVTKILGISVAVTLVAPAGIRLNFFVNMPYDFVLNLLVTIFWTLLLVSSFNAIDNMDGLASGLALVASLMFFVIGTIQFPQPLWATISLGFAGALLGFLPYNFYPAVIFLGDAGSLLLGYVLALLSVMGQWSDSPIKAAIIPVVILIIPILDLLFVILFRYLTGETNSIRESIEYSAQDHLSHRIQQVRNFGQRRTVLIVYVLGLISGLLGVVMRNSHPFEASMALLSACLLYFLVILLILPNLNKILWRW